LAHGIPYGGDLSKGQTMKAWLFQDAKQKEKLGDDTPWSVGWYDPEGRRRGKSIGSRSLAQKEARKFEGQLACGSYQSVSRASWQQFKDEYESKVLAGMEPGTRGVVQQALNNFERVIEPKKVSAINSKTIDQYITMRRGEVRKRKVSNKRKNPDAPDTLVSPATVNKELRCIKAMLRRAAEWEYLAKVPKFNFLKEPGKLAVYVTPEHFAALYLACDVAESPEQQGYTAPQWWRGLLMMAYMTGWRIGSLLALRWEDVDLEAGTALSRAADNKGRRDQLIPLHPVVVEHIARLKSFSPRVFSWTRNVRSLWEHFLRIQTAAKVQPLGKRRYGFHDLRRGFATMNADKLTADALQALMQHRSYKTTQGYINMARQLNPAVATLYVPTVDVEGYRKVAQ